MSFQPLLTAVLSTHNHGGLLACIHGIVMQMWSNLDFFICDDALTNLSCEDPLTDA